MTGPMTDGTCSLCGGTFSKGEMTGHLKTCPNRDVPEAPSGRGKLRERKLLHIVVEGDGLPEYWMHIEVPGDATLVDLDGFLRDIWLECCGHLSAFTIEGEQYQSDVHPDLPGSSMRCRLDRVLRPGLSFHHEYDFGTTTSLALKVVSERQGVAAGKSVRVLARNVPPPLVCESCGKPATLVCGECLLSDAGWLCEACAAEHECGEDMMLPVVNSPRVGMCGYTGPEDE